MPSLDDCALGGDAFHATQKMRGVLSQAMVLCAASQDGTVMELLTPPEGAKVGERIFFKGHTDQPLPQLPTKQKLGSHISKKHPGMSNAYQQKRDLHNARTGERLILREAKNIFYDLYPEEDHAKHFSRIAKFKRFIKAELSDEPHTKESVTKAAASVLYALRQKNK